MKLKGNNEKTFDSDVLLELALLAATSDTCSGVVAFRCRDLCYLCL